MTTGVYYAGILVMSWLSGYATGLIFRHIKSFIEKASRG